MKVELQQVENQDLQHAHTCPDDPIEHNKYASVLIILINFICTAPFIQEMQLQVLQNKKYRIDIKSVMIIR